MALLILPRRGGASYFYYSGLELSACVLGGVGGGLLTPFFYLQIAKRRRLCGLVALADSCLGKKAKTCRRRKMFRLGGGGGGGGGESPPCPPLPTPMQEFFFNNSIKFMLTYTSIIMVYLEACRVFVVLHFRMYVAKLMCVR